MQVSARSLRFGLRAGIVNRANVLDRDAHDCGEDISNAQRGHVPFVYSSRSLCDSAISPVRGDFGLALASAWRRLLLHSASRSSGRILSWGYEAACEARFDRNRKRLGGTPGACGMPWVWLRTDRPATTCRCRIARRCLRGSSANDARDCHGIGRDPNHMSAATCLCLSVGQNRQRYRRSRVGRVTGSYSACAYRDL